MVAFVLAFVIRFLGSGPEMVANASFCAPYSWVQAHAIWHFGNALSCVLLYRYFQDEYRISGRTGVLEDLNVFTGKKQALPVDASKLNL